MLRNIPNRYCQAQLLDEIDHAGFAGTYNFFYLPMDTHNRTNVGYAFINFYMPQSMAAFIKAFSGYRFKDHSSQKIAKVSPAHLQGFVENVRHFSNRAVTHSRNSQYRPVVVLNGQRLDLNEAVEKLIVQPYPACQYTGFEVEESEEVETFSQVAVAVPENCAMSLPLEKMVPSFLVLEDKDEPQVVPRAPDAFEVPLAFRLARQGAPAAGGGAGGHSAAGAGGFSFNRAGLEEAVSQWLRIKTGEEVSTDGGSQSGSCSASQRSSSPAEHKDVLAHGTCGRWKLPLVTDAFLAQGAAL